MNIKNIAAVIILLIVLANIIALSALPDAIIGFNLVAIVAILGLVAYFFWRRKPKN